MAGEGVLPLRRISEGILSMAQVMLASRNDELRAYLAEKLKKRGHAVTRVADLDAALTILGEAAYDMLLTTVDMSKPEELDFARTAQEIDPEMRIMFITGFSAVAVKKPDEDRDDDVLLGEPVHLIRLPEAVERLVAA